MAVLLRVRRQTKSRRLLCLHSQTSDTNLTRVYTCKIPLQLGYIEFLSASRPPRRQNPPHWTTGGKAARPRKPCLPCLLLLTPATASALTLVCLVSSADTDSREDCTDWFPFHGHAGTQIARDRLQGNTISYTTFCRHMFWPANRQSECSIASNSSPWRAVCALVETHPTLRATPHSDFKPSTTWSDAAPGTWTHVLYWLAMTVKCSYHLELNFAVLVIRVCVHWQWWRVLLKDHAPGAQKYEPTASVSHTFHYIRIDWATHFTSK